MLWGGDILKKKIYFIGSAIIQIIIAIFCIINANKIIQKLIEQASMYPENMQDRLNSLFDNSGFTYIAILAVIGIILHGVVIYLALTDKLLKAKGKVIAIAIYSLLTAFSSLAELTALIDIIVIACSKRTKPEDYPDKKKELPKLEREKVDTKKIVLAIILLMVYFSQFLWGKSIPNSGNIKLFIGLAFYLLMIVLSVLFFKDLLKDNFKVFRTNFKTYFQNLIGKIGKFYLAYIFIAFIVVILGKMGTSANQTSIEELPLWYSIPLAIIYAPIVEETLFRGCIRRFIKKDKLFIVVSALVFGLLHTVFSEANLIATLIQSIPYATLGGFLAYLYVKTNNICTNMAFHCFQNTIAMIFTILVKGF